MSKSYKYHHRFIQGVIDNDNFKYVRYYYNTGSVCYVYQLPHQERWYFYSTVDKSVASHVYDNLYSAVGAFNSVILKHYRSMFESGLQQTLFETSEERSH